MKKMTGLFDLCNQETVHIPIECLTSISSIDEKTSLSIAGLVVPVLVQLYE
jgi:hypothetical protein